MSTDSIATAPVVAGFRWSGIETGIRKRSGSPDLALLLADEPVACAGVFTQSDAAAAPVILSRPVVASGKARAVLMNAGCANAATGAPGDEAAARMAAALQAHGISSNEVLIASTGVIGQLLPVERIEKNAAQAVDAARPEGIRAFARAILTTDTVEKVASRSGIVGGKTITIAGVSKGAGMIMPNMATMLSCIATDAAVEPAILQIALSRATEESFNAITVDGDTSTNDTVYLLASGKAGNDPISEATGEDFDAFQELLNEVCLDLARAIVADGEGATKLIEVRVEEAASREEADTIARRIANSPLVKTACHAADPNWGRVIAAAGACGYHLDVSKMILSFGGVDVMRDGMGLGDEAESQAGEKMATREWTILLRLNRGNASRSIYTCDFSAEYVRINAEYRT